MKKRILALLLVIAMAITALPVFAEDAAPAWTANGTTVTDAGDGFYTISGIQYETSAYTTEKVKLDGLTIEMKLADFRYENGSNQAAGIVFSGNPAANYGSGVAAMTLWHDPYANGQSRFHVGANHDYNTASYAYTDPACNNAGFGLAASMVLNTVTNIDLKIEIKSYDANTYAVKFTSLTPHLLWGDNCNYVAEQGGTCTFYMQKSVFTSALDAEGKLYVAATGLHNPNVTVRVTETASGDEPTETPTETPTEAPTEAPTDPTPTAPSIVGTADSDWVNYSGNATGAFAANGYSTVSGMAAWGHRAYYKHLVKLDGLELSFRVTSNKGDCVGVVFSGSNGGYFGDGSKLAITYWNELYSGQARLNFGANHDYNAASAVYKTPELADTNKGFGVASSMVCNQAPTMGWTLKFESYNEEFYSIKITMTDSTMWGNNANYNADEQSCTVYLPKATVADMLNENGELYVIAAGFPSDPNPACSAEYKIVDDNYRAYIGDEGVTDAITKVEAYKNAAASITDAASYDAAMAAREAAVACAGNLRARELAELALIVGTVDAELSANEEIVLIVKKAVTDKIAAAKGAYDALIADKSTLNADTLAAALALTNDAKAEYANRASMLSEEAKAEIETAIAALDYAHDYCIALQWVTAYEGKIAALDATDPAIVDALVEVKAYRAAYETTAAYTKITTVLNEQDKAAMEAAIAAGDAAVVNIETVVLPQLKENYIAAAEEKLKADLTIKPNLDDAKAAYAEIATFVTITEADGALYTRYVTCYDALKAACEAYIRGQITAVTGLLDKEYTILDEFKAVRNQFKSIKLDYLMEENAEIAAELTTLETKISANVFYYMSATNIPVVEWNASGLAVESKVEFPARLNYNKAMNLKTGAEVVVELTSAAYYNGGSLGANNLCFNFLASPESYKSMSDGISIIIWLFPTESNVQIMNYTDTALASSTIATPLDGGDINISVKYEEYYSFVEDSTYWAYVIRVNEAEIVLTKEVLTKNGHEMPDEVYFSMGSFADNKENPNILTLVSANGVEFGKPDAPVCTDHIDEDADGKCDSCGADVEVQQPTDPTEPTDPDNGEEKLTLIQKIARFFRKIVDTIKNFFVGLIGKITGK